MLEMRTLLSAIALTATTAAASAESPKLVTILTAPEPQTQLMAMVLTMQAAQQGADTHMLLCGPAGDLALQDAPASATAAQPPRGMSPQGLMQKIASLPNATIEVCAIYLPGRDESAEVLIEGVGVAKPGPMAASILASDKLMSF